MSKNNKYFYKKNQNILIDTYFITVILGSTSFAPPHSSVSAMVL